MTLSCIIFVYYIIYVHVYDIYHTQSFASIYFHMFHISDPLISLSPGRGACQSRRFFLAREESAGSARVHGCKWDELTPVTEGKKTQRPW